MTTPQPGDLVLIRHRLRYVRSLDADGVGLKVETIGDIVAFDDGHWFPREEVKGVWRQAVDYATGGLLPPGDSVAINETGKPERLRQVLGTAADLTRTMAKILRAAWKAKASGDAESYRWWMEQLRQTRSWLR